MSNSEDTPGRTCFTGLPRSPIGWWSTGLAAAFIILFGAWWLYLAQATRPRP